MEKSETSGGKLLFEERRQAGSRAKRIIGSGGAQPFASASCLWSNSQEGLRGGHARNLSAVSIDQ
jgi:hypothetical protein